MTKELLTEDRRGEEDPISASQGQTEEEVQEKIDRKMNQFLTFEDLADEDVAENMTMTLQEQQHPFRNYNSRILRQRVYPRDPRLDTLNLSELMVYCLDRRLIHPRKMVIRKEPRFQGSDQLVEVMARCDMKKPELLEWIEKCETRTFPTDSVVFCAYRKKDSVPYSRAIYSFVTKRFEDTIFDKVWEVNGKRRRGWFAIVQDYTVRAQLIFRFDPKKRGALVIDKRFSFLEQDKRQIEPLREVFLMCQKNSKVIQDFGVASSGETAEKELFGNQLPSYQVL